MGYYQDLEAEKSSNIWVFLILRQFCSHSTVDHNGNIQHLVDASTKTIAATYMYSPFGVLIGESGKAKDACPFRFQSKYYDKETELYYFGYRYYDARTCKWLSRDPKGESGGINLTAFCGNDPVNKWDYLGLHAEVEVAEDNGVAYVVITLKFFFNDKNMSKTMKKRWLEGVQTAWAENYRRETGKYVVRVRLIEVDKMGPDVNEVRFMTPKKKVALSDILKAPPTAYKYLEDKQSRAHVAPGQYGGYIEELNYSDYYLMQIRYNEYPRVFAHEAGHLMGVPHPIWDEWRDKKPISISEVESYKQLGYKVSENIFVVGELNLPALTQGLKVGDKGVWVGKKVEVSRYSNARNSIMGVGAYAFPEDIQVAIDFAEAVGRLTSMDKDTLIKKYKGIAWIQLLEED